MRHIALPVILTFFFCQTLFSQELSLASPNGHILFHLINNPGGLAYNLNFQQKEIVSRGRMGFEFMKEPALGTGLSIVKKKTLAVRNTWYPVVRVKRTRMEDSYNSLWLSLKEDTGLRRSMELEVRAYDDGIAFRYKLPAASAIGSRVITRELTSFPFPGDAKAWVAQYGGYATSQESEFKPVWLRDLTRQTVAGLPMLIQVDTSVFAAVTEAAIVHYPGSYLGSDSLQDGRVLLTTRLAPLPGEPVDGPKARFDDSVYTPWRVIMLAETPGRLIESGIIENLNPPCAIKDPSWIKPGISAWDHWWSGEVKMDMPTIRQYIDLAASQGWPYMLVDWQWYGPFNDPRADITRTAPQLDMPALLAYAASKHVRLWLWLYSSDVNRNNNYEKARDITLNLDFLPKGAYQLVSWEDAADAGAHPRNLVKRTRRITSAAPLQITMAKGGGFVGYLDNQ
jgi:alpha-glucosidase